MSVRKMILGSTLGIAAAAALVAAYAVIPRPADLRAFDPAEMARLETAMWRDYYDKRYAALFYHLYEIDADAVRLFAARKLADRARRRRGRQDVPADAVTTGGRCGPASARWILPGFCIGRACGIRRARGRPSRA